MKWIVLAVLLLGAVEASSATSQGVAEAWLAGNRLYEEQDYAGAAKAYLRVIEHGFTAPELEYNLANALLKSDQLGRAVLHYKRALFLKPSFKDARHNLHYARSLTSDVKPDPSQESGLLSFLSRFGLGATQASWACVICAVLFTLASSLRRLFWPDKAASLVLQGMSGFVFVLAVLALLFELNRSASYEEGVVLATQVNVLAGPGDGHTVNFRLHEGAELELLRQAGEWQEVKVSDGLQGWVASEAVAPVNPNSKR